MSDSVVIAATGEVIAHRVRWARSLRDRLRGLIGVVHMQPGDALIIQPARQVHTFGMKVSIDVVFCDIDGEVRHVVRRMRPGRITRWVASASFAIELAGGSLPAAVEPGERVIFG